MATPAPSLACNKDEMAGQRREPGTLKHRKELSGGRSGTEAWKGAPRADYKKMSRGVLLGEQPELGNILLMVTPPGSLSSVTHAKDFSDEAKTLPNTNVSPHAPSTPHRDHLADIL